ncbi:MAG: ribosome biogenesis GTPase Der, partial [Phenylobacterium sp.]
LVEREGRAIVFVLAKWDLIEDPQSRLAEIRESLDRQLPQVRGAPLVALSAETGRHVDRLMPAVFKVHADWSTKVKTRDLNDWLALAIQRHPPPAVNGRRVRPKYMAQTKARPPTFVLFATRADQLPDHYRRYLVHALRESFDLPGVPIRVSVRSSRNPFVDGPAPQGGASAGRSRPAVRKPAGTTKVKAKVSGKSAAKSGAKPVSKAPQARKAAGLRPPPKGATGRPVRPKGPGSRARPSRPGKN